MLGTYLNWHWLLVPAALLALWSASYLLSRLCQRLLLHLTSRTKSAWDEELVGRLGTPLSCAWMLLPTHAVLLWLKLPSPILSTVHRMWRVGLLFVLFWAISRSMDVLLQAVSDSVWLRSHPALRSFLPVVRRVATVALWGLALVALLSELGYPVASLIAGLGIGGLAIALAAQKTVENLFGAFSIAADQPFVEGDFVKVEDFVGTVESIGLRSTKIRTLDRTLITLPNGRLAEMRLESYAARDRLRLACTLGLVYATTGEQMRTVLLGCEQVLREHPKIWPETVVVRFKELGESSLNIEVMAWFQTADWAEFQLIRQDVLLQFMDVVARAGSAFAFPSRTLYIA